MSTLWATTFSADLWETSGRFLVESFIATQTPGTLVAYVEGMNLPVQHPNIVVHRVDDDPVLQKFLVDNRDIIPASLGGLVAEPECRCPGGPLDVHSNKHRLPCVGYWFCKNASRWMRKPLAAKMAIDTYGDKFRTMMWVDSDATFLKMVPAAVVESWFQGKYGCIYLKHKRTAIETGVFGYHLGLGGARIAAAVLDRYTSGAFRQDKRWDDCVQMEQGINSVRVKALDVATGTGPNNTVIQFSPLALYLGHAKGSHRRAGKLT